MKHIGDITQINTAEIEIPDVIIGGSPCQDLSQAGARAGIQGERSGLFMEQLRIVRELRERDRTDNRRAGEYVRPRYMVWENVPGVLSVNGGEDFQAVLTEIVKIAKADSPDVPLFGGGKRWEKSGCLMGIGDSGQPFSVAYRVHDAQFWGTTLYDDAGNIIRQGTPQRRRRIALVADFNGLSAPEILFVRKGLQGDFTEIGAEGETFAEGTERSVGVSGRTHRRDTQGNGVAISFQDRAGKPGGGKGILIQEDHVGSLKTGNNQMVFEQHSQDSRYNKMGGCLKL